MVEEDKRRRQRRRAIVNNDTTSSVAPTAIPMAMPVGRAWWVVATAEDDVVIANIASVDVDVDIGVNDAVLVEVDGAVSVCEASEPMEDAIVTYCVIVGDPGLEKEFSQSYVAVRIMTSPGVDTSLQYIISTSLYASKKAVLQYGQVGSVLDQFVLKGLLSIYTGSVGTHQ